MAFNCPVLDHASLHSETIGAIVNLMSVDAQRLQDICAYIHMLWSGPYQIILSLIFLGIQLGWAMFAGIGVMLIMFPISAAIAAKIKTLQQELMKIKDDRIKVTNEVMAGMKIIKLYAWEIRLIMFCFVTWHCSPAGLPYVVSVFFVCVSVVDGLFHVTWPSFGTKLDDIRARELRYLTKYVACQLLSRFLWTIVPAATAVATFATYVVSH